jgi:hypothetical protein
VLTNYAAEADGRTSDDVVAALIAQLPKTDAA